MRGLLLGVIGALLLGGMTAAGSAQERGRWSREAVAALAGQVRAAPAEALPLLSLAGLERALATGDAAALDRTATALALDLARLHLRGCTPAAERSGWSIADGNDVKGLEARLHAALTAGQIDSFFAGLKPRHPDYAHLRQAYATETDPARRATLALNMERWRWMPQDLGSSFVLVNAARFELELWRQGVRSGTWPVIVGKPQTPTPVFAATITGIVFNPWWDIPASIVRESIGALVRNNPALARQRGYVWGGGRYRQRPGPNNALGQMKLVMPNPYRVYLHDTPSRQLFTREVRAMSHGCVRVGDALGFAAVLAQGARSQAEVEALVASGRSVEIALAERLPVYITYFTAVPAAEGAVALLPDIYGRDAAATGAGPRNWPCAS